MMALMVGWILQKTRTIPACLKSSLLDVPGAYRPTSKGWPLKFEKALWKIGSRFGKSTVLPDRDRDDVRQEVTILLTHNLAPRGARRSVERSAGLSQSTTPE